MTPQERKLLDELFDRLASLENDQRDPGAVDAINEGLKRAPNALYPLVQTALVQDEALKRAAARIHELEQELELEPGEPVQQPGFLDNMRDALIGRRESHGSVPSVRPGGAPAANSPWGNMGAQNPGGQSGAYATQPQAPGGYGAPPTGGGSFLGTAAATAAGVVGGALLMNSFRGMFGNAHAAPASAFDSGGSGSPWSSASGSSAARDAGIDDIGRGGGGGDGSQRAGLVDTAQADADSDDDQDADDDDGDFDGGDDGGSDNA